MNPEAPDVKRPRFQMDFILRAGVIVFILIIAAKFLNFFKKILIGNLFGISWQADSFFAASYLPYEIGVFFEGVVYLGLLPLFSRVMAQKGEEEGRRFAAEMLFVILLLTGMITVALLFGSEAVMRVIVPGFAPERQLLTAGLFRVVSLLVVFITLAAFFQSLNSYYDHYQIAAARGVVDTVVMIGVMIALCPLLGIYSAAWAAVAGAFANFMFQTAFLSRRFRISFRHFVPFPFQTLLELLKVLVPIGAIWIFQTVPLVILNRFGSGMWQGTISALVIAQGIMVVPTALVSQTVLISIFPSLARQAGSEGHEEAKETFFQILRAAFFILIPSGLILSALSKPIAVLFFSGSGSNTEGTLRIANALACLGWSAFAFYADLFMTQSLIAMRKILPAVCLCVTRAILTYGFSFFLSSFWDYRGLALSFSLALACNFFVFFPFFFGWTPLKGKWQDLFGYCGKLFLAASPILMGLFILHCGFVSMGPSLPFVKNILGMGLFALIAAAFYLLILSRFKLKEFDSVVGIIKKIRERKPSWIADGSDV